MEASRVVIGSITNCLSRTYHRIGCEKVCTPLRHGITWLFTSPLHSRLCIQSSSSAARTKEGSTDDGEEPKSLSKRQASSSSSSSSKSGESSPSLTSSTEPGSPLVPSVSPLNSSQKELINEEEEIGETDGEDHKEDHKEKGIKKITNKKIPNQLKREWESALEKEDHNKVSFFARIGELIKIHKSHNLYAQQNEQRATALHSMENDDLIELRWQLENIQAPRGKCAKTTLVILKSIVYVLTIRALWLTVGTYLLYLTTLNPKVQEKLPSQDSLLSKGLVVLSVLTWNLQNAVITILLLYCLNRWVPNPFSRGAAKALEGSKS